MPLHIVRQDITKMKVDAIVNAANTELLMGGGVCGAIFNAAGIGELKAACSALAPAKTASPVITPGFALPCKYIIHVAGPVYDKHNPLESERFLRISYIESLHLALDNDCKSIAFPLISSGIYGYPKDDALSVARKAIELFLQNEEMEVYLVVFDKKTFVISEKLLGSVESYVDEVYVLEHSEANRELLSIEMNCYNASRSSIDDVVGNLDEPFSDTILRIIDTKGMTDVEVYKRANIDRKLFSKIRKPGYTPSKRTVIALALALRLSLTETEDLLACAGYALSHSQKFDVIIEYFIVESDYDVFKINEVLFKYDQPLLGA